MIKPLSIKWLFHFQHLVSQKCRNSYTSLTFCKSLERVSSRCSLIGFAENGKRNMTETQTRFFNYLKFGLIYLRQNPHLALSFCLFSFGSALINTKASMVAGALYGAGASLLGAWVTEFNTKRSREQDRLKQESDAKRHLAPELKRIIERTR